MSLTLRPYQEEAVAAVERELATNASTIVVHATGTGKGTLLAALVKRALDKRQGARVLVTVHRDMLVRDLAKRIEGVIGEYVDIEKAEEYANGARVVIGSLQTMCKESRRARFHPNTFDLVINDECFPAGTSVDGRPIESLGVGDKVLAFDEHAGRLELRRIARRFVSEPKSMVRVRTERGAIACTAGHPFWTGRGWVAASLLSGDDVVLCANETVRDMRGDDEAGVGPGNLLRGVQGRAETSSTGGDGLGRRVQDLRRSAQAAWPEGERGQESRRRELQSSVREEIARSGSGHRHGGDKSQVRLGAYEGQQPHGAPRRARAHEDLAACDGMEAAPPRRERPGTDGAAVGTRLVAGLADGGGRAHAHEAGHGVSELLQAGHRERDAEGRRGGGRELALLAPASGPEEGRLSGWARVDGVEVLEPGSDGTFGGVCPDGLVYNLEVEGLHTYVAGGFVVHNCHHAVSPSFRSVHSHFTGARLIGLTATPSRGDRQAMGQVFESVAHVYDIADAIRDGWLVPLKTRPVFVESVDLSHVDTVAGDFNQGQLEEIMALEKSLYGIAEPLVVGANGSPPLAGNRATIVSTTSIRNAERLSDIINNMRAGAASCIHSELDDDEKLKRMRKFREREFQFMVHVGILGEGVDLPFVSCLAMARPTKSPTVVSQHVGRTTRPCYAMDASLSPAERRALIAASDKPDSLILTFAGAVGKHHLSTPHDILAGRYGEDVVARAKRISEEDPDVDILTSLERAEKFILDEAEAEKLRQLKLKAKVKVRVGSTVDPFAVLDVPNPGAGKWGDQFGAPMPSEKQLAMLRKHKIPIAEGMTRAQAATIIGEMMRRWDEKLCSFGQAKVLKKYGYDTSTLTFARASEMIDALSKNGWKRPRDFGDGVANSRTVGEEG